MRYLLVLGFYCDIYKKKPTAKLYVNDKLLDEFTINQYKSNQKKEQEALQKNKIPAASHLLDTNGNTKLHPYIFLKFCPTLRFYEIELGNDIKNVELKIQLENDDNNYTNGFLSRHTYLTLKICYFFPLNKELLERFTKIKDKKSISKNYAWYRRNKIVIFDCRANGMEWHINNNKINLGRGEMFTTDYLISGSGYLVCNLIKKYGIYVPIFNKPYRYDCHGKLLILLLDKYQQHANQ